MTISLQPESGSSQFRQCAIFDRLSLGISSALTGAGVARISNQVDVAGWSRFRYKVFHTSTWEFFVLERILNWTTPTNWSVTSFGIFGPGRQVFNFGRGTGILTAFSGSHIIMSAINQGPGAGQITEVELWMQS